jgi:hypothetical protein
MKKGALYLKHLSRHIDLNQARAKMASRPAGYQWSNYAAFIGKHKLPRFLQNG